MASVTAAADELISTTVTLPAGKLCDYCTLQWIWAARGDGGSYLACADISITTTGLLPDFDTGEQSAVVVVVVRVADSSNQQ